MGRLVLCITLGFSAMPGCGEDSCDDARSCCERGLETFEAVVTASTSLNCDPVATSTDAAQCTEIRNAWVDALQEARLRVPEPCW